MKNNRIFSVLGASALFAMATPVFATTWTFTSSSPCTQNDISGGGSPGNTTWCTSGGITSTAQGYSNTGNNNSSSNSSSATLQTAYLYTWDGLGVQNRDNSSSQDSSESNVPEHSTDNNQRNDMVLFSFTESGSDVKVHLTDINIGWVNDQNNGYEKYDADFTVMAYTGSGTPSMTGTYASLSGWTVIGHYNAYDTGTKTITYAAGQENTFSSYWLIGAYNANVAGGASCRNADTSAGSIGSSSGGCDDGDDFIKIASVSGTKTPPPPPPNQQVPEPATLGLLGIGLLGLTSLRRRRS